MRLDLMTWYEVDACLRRGSAIILPMGSTEQHGPVGLIGTDALCAEAIADAVGERTGTIVAPTLALAPAPFNMAFPGTLSLSEPVFEAVLTEVLQGLAHHGFRHIYILNGHGANLAPARRVASATTDIEIRIRSWWDFDAVNDLGRAYHGDWQGMHATPSEVAITRALHRTVEHADALQPPARLSRAFIEAHAGDKHGPPDEHRARFPDGRVGSHSALATADQGRALFEAAVTAASADLRTFASKAAAQSDATDQDARQDNATSRA